MYAASSVQVGDLPELGLHHEEHRQDQQQRQTAGEALDDAHETSLCLSNGPSRSMPRRTTAKATAKQIRPGSACGVVPIPRTPIHGLKTLPSTANRIASTTSVQVKTLALRRRRPRIRLHDRREDSAAVEMAVTNRTGKHGQRQQELPGVQIQPRRGAQLEGRHAEQQEQQRREPVLERIFTRELRDPVQLEPRLDRGGKRAVA
jgi:hypothetical protein